VRVYESRMDLLRAVIIGPAGTPYHDGLFVFDAVFPSSYPNDPPVCSSSLAIFMFAMFTCCYSSVIACNIIKSFFLKKKNYLTVTLSCLGSDVS